MKTLKVHKKQLVGVKLTSVVISDSSKLEMPGPWDKHQEQQLVRKGARLNRETSCMWWWQG